MRTKCEFAANAPRARILEAVREAKGDDAAERIAGLKKPEMVTAAEELLVGTGWLPEPLRTLPLAEEVPSEDGPVAEVDIDNSADVGTSAEDDDADPETEDEASVETAEDPVDEAAVADDAAVRTAAE